MYDLSIVIPALAMFSNVASGSLALFLQPIFSLRTLHSFFVSQVVTSRTIASISSLFSFKLMPMNTQSLSCGSATDIITSKIIYSLCNEFKMFWVTANNIFTKVVNLSISIVSSSRQTPWYRSIGESIHKSMNFLLFSSIKALRIPTRIKCSLPFPATNFHYILKYSFVFFSRKFNYKHIHGGIIPAL